MDNRELTDLCLSVDCATALPFYVLTLVLPSIFGGFFNLKKLLVSTSIMKKKPQRKGGQLKKRMRVQFRLGFPGPEQYLFSSSWSRAALDRFSVLSLCLCVAVAVAVAVVVAFLLLP